MVGKRGDPNPEASVPSAAELVRNWLYRHLGRAGFPLILALAAAYFLITNWVAIKRLPPVAYLINRWEAEPIPRADPNRYTIAVAKLDGDRNHAFENLIVENLQDLPGIQVLEIDRTIRALGANPDSTEVAGNRAARGYLRQSGAEVLIWGIVLREDGKSAVRLYWTTSTTENRSEEAFQPKNFKLPALFWSELVQVLRLMVVAHVADAIGEGTHPIAAQLPDFIGRVRTLLTGGEAEGWTIGTRAQVRYCLAYALHVLGVQSGQNEPLEEAVHQYRVVLTEVREDQMPKEWAEAENGLGMSLSELGRREHGSADLTKSIAAYRCALKVRTRKAFPYDWAITEQNLAIDFYELGRRGVGSASLSEGIDADKKALEVLDRRRDPLDWAVAEHNLSNMLSTLAERTHSRRAMLAAIAAQQNALGVLSMRATPIDWATGQLTLASELRWLGLTDKDESKLSSAIADIKKALYVETEASLPLQWASAQDNLGNALRDLGEQKGDSRLLRDAVIAHECALTVFSRDRTPIDWGMCELNLGTALLTLAEKEKDAQMICDSLTSDLSAVAVFSANEENFRSKARDNAADATNSLMEHASQAECQNCLQKNAALLHRVAPGILEMRCPKN